MKKALLLLFLSYPLFAEEALGVPVPTGLQIYQTNMEGMEKAQYVSSAIEGAKPTFYFLVLWGKFSSNNLSEVMPENIGGTQLIFSTSAKNIDRVEFYITGKNNTNFVLRELELTNNVYKKSKDEFDILGLVGLLGEDTNGYGSISLTFYQGKKVVDKQTLSEQEITQLKKAMPFAKDILSKSIEALAAALYKAMEDGWKNTAP